MPTINDYRNKYPSLKALDDAALIDRVAEVQGVSREDVMAHMGYKPKPRGILSFANDTVIETANAIAGGVKSVGDFVAPGNPVSQFIDDNIIKAGEAKQSDVVKAEKARYQADMANAEGVGDEIGATLGYVARNPIQSLAQAAGSFVLPGAAVKAGGMLGSVAGLGVKGVTNAGLAGGAVAGAALSGGDAAGTAYDLVKKAGGTDDDATGAARQASVLPAIIGGAGGLVGAERLVAGAGGFKGGMLSRALKTAGVEGAQEALEEGVTQYEGQRAAVPFDPTIDPMKGVAGAATMGAALGAATGGAVSLLEGGNGHAAKPGVADILGATDLDKAIDFSMEAVSTPTKKADEPLGLAKPGEGLDFEADPRFAGAPILRNGDGKAPTFGSKQQADIYIGEQALFQSHEAVEVAPGRWEVQPTAATLELLKPRTDIPVGEVTEGPPAGEARELTDEERAAYVNEVPFSYQERMKRMPQPEVTEVVPTGEATELEDIPAGEATELDVETIQPGDLLTGDQQPYGSKIAASVRAKKAGGSVVAVRGGWVVRLPQNSGYVQPAPFEAVGNGRFADSAKVGAFGQSEAGGNQRLGDIDIPRQRMMLPRVLGWTEDNEIFRRVVGSIPVNVMDMLAGQKWATKDLFSNKSVLQRALTSAVENDVPTGVKVAAGNVMRAVAGVAAELGAPGANPVTGPGKLLPAMNAGKRPVGTEKGPLALSETESAARFGGADGGFGAGKGNAADRTLEGKQVNSPTRIDERGPSSGATNDGPPTVRASSVGGKQPNNTRGTNAADVARPGGQRADDRSGSDGVAGVPDQRPSDVLASPAATEGQGVAGAGTAGGGSAEPAALSGAAPELTPGTKVTLNGTPYTVTSANNSAVKLQSADGITKMVARNSKTFGQIQGASNGDNATVPSVGDAGNQRQGGDGGRGEPVVQLNRAGVDAGSAARRNADADLQGADSVPDAGAGQSLSERLAAIQPKPADGVSRAAAGGQIGVNGYEYKGGQFLPSTQLPPGSYRDKDGTVRKGNKGEQIEPGKREGAPSPTSRAVYGVMGGYVRIDRETGKASIIPNIRDMTGAPVTPETMFRPGVKGLTTDQQYTLQELVDLYNKGARWIELDLANKPNEATRPQPEAQRAEAAAPAAAPAPAAPAVVPGATSGALEADGVKRPAATPSAEAAPAPTEVTPAASMSVSTGDPMKRLGAVMQRAGWEIDYIDLDLTGDKPKADIRVNRGDGRFVIAKVDGQGRATMETFQRTRGLGIDPKNKQARLAPQIDDQFLGRQKFEGARSMLRGMVTYLADNATNPVALADMKAAWAGVMAGPVNNTQALPAPQAAPAPAPEAAPAELPRLPVEAYRVERRYANGAVIRPLPGKAFTDGEVQQIAGWFRAAKWEVSTAAPSGVSGVNNAGMSADDIPEPYTAAQRKKDERQRDADAATAAKTAAQDDYLTGTAAGKYVAAAFGDTLNKFNSVALAKFLAGEASTFDGLMNARAADVVQGMGIAVEGRATKDVLADLKARFAGQATPAPTLTPKAQAVKEALAAKKGGQAEPPKRTEVSGKAKHPKTVAGSSVLAMVSQSLGGLDPAWLGEFSSRQEVNRIGKDGRRMVQWRNPLIPGVGRLFRKGGTQDLHLLAELMESAGYLEPGSVEADTYEAGQRAKEMVREALQGDEPLTWQGRIAKAQEEARDEALSEPDWLAEFDDSELDDAGYTAASPEVQQATAALLAEAEAQGLDVESLTERAAMQSDGQSEGAYHEALQGLAREAIAAAGRQTGRPDAAAAGGSNPDRGAADAQTGAKPAAKEGLKRPPVAEGDRIRFTSKDGATIDGMAVQVLDTSGGNYRIKIRTDEPAPQGGGNISRTVYSQDGTFAPLDEPLLTAQTTEDLKAKTEREEAATAAERAKKTAEQERLRREAEQRDNRARADQTVDDFQLGQSADEQMSGMGDLFSQPAPAPQPEAEAPAPAAGKQYPTTAEGAIQAFNEDDSAQAVAIMAKLKLDDLKTVGDAVGFRPQYNETAKAFRERIGAVAGKLEKTSREKARRQRVLFDKLTDRAMAYDRAADHAARAKANGVADDSTAYDSFYTPMGGGETQMMRIPAMLDRLAGDVKSLQDDPDYAEVAPLVQKARPRVFEHKASAAPAEAPKAEQAPAEQAAAILNAAAEPPKGKERLDVLKDVKAGAITPEEVAAAYPAAEAAPAPEKPAAPNTEDAGAELTYNRRNRIKTGIKWDDIASKNAALKVKEAVKQNVYPRPDYQALVAGGMNPLVAHLVKQVYDSIAAKPSTRGAPTDADLQTYIAGVNRVMAGVMAWVNDSASVARWAAREARSAGAALGRAVNLSDLATSGGKSMLEMVYPDGWKANQPEVVLLGGNKLLGALQPGYDESRRASKAVSAGWPESQEAWEKRGIKIVHADKIDVDYYEGKNGRDGQPYVSVSFKVGDTRLFDRVVRGVESQNDPKVKEAVAEELAANQGKFIVMDKMRRILGRQDTDEAAKDVAREVTKREGKSGPDDSGIDVSMATREGVPRRLPGEDISSERLKDAFGLKGVNFGNWMKGDTPALRAERQAHLNHAYDSFADLAEVLGVPPKAMSLNGMLGLAIGAQGNGKYAAHFVPGVNEINLTRTSGAGSLAHEFGHALDHYFAVQAGFAMRAEPFLTEHTTSVNRKVIVENGRQKLVESSEDRQIRPEVVERFKAIVQAMNRKPETLEQFNARQDAAKADAKRRVEGWLNAIRRDYLKAGVDEAAFDAIANRIKALDLGEGKVSVSSSLYVSPPVDELRSLYRKKTGKVPPIDQIKGLQSNLDHLAYMMSERRSALDHVPQQVATDYAKAAAALDKEKGGKPYWSTNLEKFARAFDAFVSDELEAKAAKNTYLSHAGRTGETVPAGDERKSINAALKALVSDLQTREDDAGNVTVFSRPGSPYWFSALSDQVEKASMNAGPASAWQSMLKNWISTGKVKADEVEWSGLGDWLGMQQGKVSKAQVAEFLDAKRSAEDDAQFSRANQVPLEASDAVGREFWRKIDNGESFTQQEVLDALATNRRGTVRKTRALQDAANVSGIGETPIGWQGDLASFGPYSSRAMWVGDHFSVFFIPDSIAGNADLNDPQQAREHALVHVAMTPAGNGKFNVSLNDPPPGSTAERAAVDADVAAKTGVDGNQYTRIDLDAGDVKSVTILQEAVRRLALNIGQTPAVFYAQRDTGARAGRANSGRGYTADQVSARFSTMRGGPNRGVPMPDAKAVVARIRAALPTAPPVHLLETLNQAPKALREAIKASGAEALEAAYHAGEIYVFPRNIPSIERMQFVVAHHEVRHHGIRTRLGTGDELGAAMHAMWEGNENLRKLAQAKIDAGLASTRALAVEEALADMDPAEVAQFKGWPRVVAAMRQWLRQVAAKFRAAGLAALADAIEPKTWTDADVARFILKAEGVSKGDTTLMRAGGTVFAQRAYHGTPYRGIDKFSTDKIGTGEGAQAYGWGLYFASKREVAEHYRETLSRPQIALNGEPLRWQDDDFANALRNVLRRTRRGVDFDEAIASEAQVLEVSKAPSKMRDAAALLKVREGSISEVTQGQLYEVNIPEDSELLLWDKPVREQPDAIREAIYNVSAGKWMTGASGERRFIQPPDASMTGGAAYARISRLLGGDQAASEALAASGVKGIKYLDGDSRADGDGTFNYVIFSGDDVAITGTVYSRPAPSQVAKAVRSTVADFMGNAGAKVSWWDKTLATQYAKAEKFPAFKRVFDHAQQYLEDVSSLANQAADKAPSILPKLETWKDLKNFGLSEADAKAVAGPIFTGTLTDEKVYGDDELRSKFNLTPAQIKQYREFLATVNESLDQVVAADVLRLLGDKNPALRELAVEDRAALRNGVQEYLEGQIAEADDPEAAAELQQTLKSIQDKYARVDDLKAKGYAPLMRFGRYAVNVEDPATGESLFFGLYESRRAANAAFRDLQQDPKFARATITQGVLSEEQYKLFSTVPMESLEMFAEAIGASDSEVFQQYLKLAKNNRSALKRMIQRKGTAGFSEDVPRVLAAFTTSNARLASNILNMGAAKEAAMDIRDGDIKDEAIKLVETVSNPGDRAGWIRGMMFTQFIGGSVASALVNLTQPVTMTLPYLSQFGGTAAASKRLLAAGKIAATGKPGNPALALALKRAEADGVVSPQEIHHLVSQAAGSWGNHPWLKRAAFVWSAPFSLAEQFNRRVTFIAAWNTAKEQGIDDPFGFASKAVIETQGLYSSANMPNWARTPLGAAALTFKQFSISYLEWMGRMWKSGPEGKKAVGVALALLILMAGTDGLPFADDMDDLVDTIAQALGYDLNSKKARRNFVANTLGFGDEGADVAARGFSALAGFPLDVSLRMSMGNLIPGSGILLRSNTDKSGALLEVAGPAGSLAKQYLEGAAGLLRGEPADAAKLVVPIAVQNVLKGAEMAATGEARDQLGRKVMDVDAMDATVKAIGFNPSSIARESQKISMVRRSEQLAKNVEGEIAAEWARAIVDKDQDGIAEARRKLAEWNEDNPENRIRITMAQLIERTKKLRQTREQRFITTVSPERRQAVAEAIR